MVGYIIEQFLIVLLHLGLLLGMLFLMDMDANAADFPQKLIEVDLSEQQLTAKEGGQTVYQFPVSTGRKNTPTSTGGYWPWIKLRYDDMSGGSRARGDYYNLADVPYVVYFYNENVPRSRSYAIHGTYWHNNFGTPMSHGCINLRTSDMALLYPWIDVPNTSKPGTVIVVKH